MIRLKKLGHIQLRVADLERSKAFYRDVLGFRVAEQDPKHGDLFMTLGEDFHTLDMAQHENPEAARGQARPLGVAHIAFQVASYEALGEAYRTLLQHGVRIERAMDHVNQRSIYFLDPPMVTAWRSTTRCRARSCASPRVEATRTASWPSAAWESRCPAGSQSGGPAASSD
jgi:catechol 2,3-dioxygenase-like lactoylglutathione lyase family enzyme